MDIIATAEYEALRNPGERRDILPLVHNRDNEGDAAGLLDGLCIGLWNRRLGPAPEFLCLGGDGNNRRHVTPISVVARFIGVINCLPNKLDNYIMLLPEHDLSVFYIDYDCLSLFDRAVEDFYGKGVLKRPLDDAFQRPGAKHRVIPLDGKGCLCRIREGEVDLFLL